MAAPLSPGNGTNFLAIQNCLDKSEIAMLQYKQRTFVLNIVGILPAFFSRTDIHTKLNNTGSTKHGAVVVLLRKGVYVFFLL